MSTSLHMLNAECKQKRSQFLMQMFWMCELPKEWLLTPHFSVRRLSGLQYSQTRARITSCIAKSNHEGCYKCPRNITAQTRGGSVRRAHLEGAAFEFLLQNKCKTWSAWDCAADPELIVWMVNTRQNCAASYRNCSVWKSWGTSTLAAARTVKTPAPICQDTACQQQLSPIPVKVKLGQKV